MECSAITVGPHGCSPSPVTETEMLPRISLKTQLVPATTALFVGFLFCLMLNGFLVVSQGLECRFNIRQGQLTHPRGRQGGCH